MNEDLREVKCRFKYNAKIKLTRKQQKQLQGADKPRQFACFAQPVLHKSELECIFINDEQFLIINRAITRALKLEAGDE